MNYNENQLKAINHHLGHCCVMASAGSGKTSVLVKRIENLILNHNVPPEYILAITFSRKAADNMKSKLTTLLSDKIESLNIETFHSLGYKILKDNGIIFSQHQLLKDWEKKSIIEDICVDLHIVDKADRDNIDTNGIIFFISWQKNNLISPADKLIDISATYDIDSMRKIYSAYEDKKNQDNKIDFDDMIYQSYRVITLNGKIKAEYQNKYKFILVDESQDTNKAQYEMVKLLGHNNNVFMVGDALQCIYGFRGSNNNYILKFYKEWDNPTIINLNTNYRSTNDIVKLSNKLVCGTKETSHDYYIESKANQSDYKQPELIHYTDEHEEGKGICKKIKELSNTYKFDDFAILTRTNFQMQAIERELYLSNIPYEIVGGDSFYNLKEIRDMVSFLKLATIGDDNSFRMICNVPNRFLGKVFVGDVEKYAIPNRLSLYEAMFEFPRATEWRYRKGISELENIVWKIRQNKNENVGETIKMIRNELNYDNYISKDMYDNNDQSEKIENLDTLVSLASEYNSIDLFLEDVEKMSNPKKDEGIEKVKIMTIHKSKGLEFPVVFVTGVNAGILPHAKSSDENEEKRLLYVALTRAEKELYVSYVDKYNNKKIDPSEFLKTIFTFVIE